MSARGTVAGAAEGPRASREGLRAARPSVDPAEFDVDEHPDQHFRDPTQIAARMEAAVAAVTALHSEIARLNPEPPEWNYLRTSDGAEIDTKLLQLAWDPENKSLLDERIYKVALDLTKPSRAQRIEIWRAHNVAVQARAAVDQAFSKYSAEAKAAKQKLATRNLEKLSSDFTLRELALVDTEAAFMAHINVLKDRAGLGGRTLQKAMAACDQKITPAASTLCGWLASRTLPPAGEKTIRLLVQVVLEHIGDIKDVPEVVAEHLRVWRSLIVERHAAGLVDSPIRLALQRLAELEKNAPPGAGSRMAYRMALADAEQAIRDVLKETRRATDAFTPKMAS
ncbi:hypothetical protein ACFQ68_13310 [Amycolatopsis japonica]|uniref:hypothetical protein n=1 Tax=Amycolatopsis japonica TaxID=208439 RepID=UPI00366A6C3E